MQAYLWPRYSRNGGSILGLNELRVDMDKEGRRRTDEKILGSFQ